jgi:hypothetical protein
VELGARQHGERRARLRERLPHGGGEAVVGADQSGWVYSINPASGAVNWVVKLNADAIQGAVSTYLRAYMLPGSAMATV